MFDFWFYWNSYRLLALNCYEVILGFALIMQLLLHKNLELMMKLLNKCHYINIHGFNDITV